MRYFFVTCAGLDVISLKIMQYYTDMLLKRQFKGFTVTETLPEKFKGDETLFNDNNIKKIYQILEENRKEISYVTGNSKQCFISDKTTLFIDFQNFEELEDWGYFFSKCGSDNIKTVLLKSSPFLKIPFLVKNNANNPDLIEEEMQYLFEDTLEVVQYLNKFDEVITLEDFLEGKIFGGSILKYNTVLEMTSIISKEWFTSNLDLIKYAFNILSSKFSTSQLLQLGYNKPTFEEFKSLFCNNI